MISLPPLNIRDIPCIITHTALVPMKTIVWLLSKVLKSRYLKIFAGMKCLVTYESMRALGCFLQLIRGSNSCLAHGKVPKLFVITTPFPTRINSEQVCQNRSSVCHLWFMILRSCCLRAGLGFTGEKWQTAICWPPLPPICSCGTSPEGSAAQLCRTGDSRRIPEADSRRHFPAMGTAPLSGATDWRNGSAVTWPS